MERAGVGSDEELARVGDLDAGVAYEDPIEVSWGMRLNTPEDPDEFFAREVQFWVKTGNIIARGIFDPGGGEDSPTDAPPNASDPEDFTDFILDWQNAIPVFFAGAQGNVQGTGRMGIFTPGDFGADGSVNLDDFNRLAANWGQAGTTYSRGDHTQDGLTNDADATAWAGVAGEDVKAEAVSAVSADVDAGGTLYDFDGSGVTDAADVSFITDLLGVVAGCVPINALAGDLDGDGSVAFADFLVLSANFGTEVSTYAEGDVDCDGSVAFGDFLQLSANFGNSLGATEAASVPEPQGLTLLALGALALLRKRRTAHASSPPKT